jgi:hypothetical protein
MKHRQYPGIMFFAAAMITVLLLISPVGGYDPPGGGGGGGSGGSGGSTSSGSTSSGSSEVTYATTTISGPLTPVGEGWAMSTFKNNLPVTMIAIQTDPRESASKGNFSPPTGSSPSDPPTISDSSVIIPQMGEVGSFQMQIAVMSHEKQATIRETLTETKTEYIDVVINTTGMGPATIAVLRANGGDTTTDAYKKSVERYQRQKSGTSTSGPVKITSMTVQRAVTKTPGGNQGAATSTQAQNSMTDTSNTLTQTQNSLTKLQNTLVENSNPLTTTHTLGRTASTIHDEATAALPVLIATGV